MILRKRWDARSTGRRFCRRRRFALKFALGEMAGALLLASQRVAPSRLEQLGHRFAQRDLSLALASVLAER